MRERSYTHQTKRDIEAADPPPLLLDLMILTSCGMVMMADDQVQVKSISTSGLHPVMPESAGGSVTIASLRDRELMENSCSSLQFISDTGTFGDETSYESVSTSAILRYCKMKVLKPYFRLLSILGWRPLISQNTLFENAYWARIINCTYAVLILSLILTGYVLQFSSCYRQDGYRPYADPVTPDRSDQQENNNSRQGGSCNRTYHSLVRADGLHDDDLKSLNRLLDADARRENIESASSRQKGILAQTIDAMIHRSETNNGTDGGANKLKQLDERELKLSADGESNSSSNCCNVTSAEPSNGSRRESNEEIDDVEDEEGDTPHDLESKDGNEATTDPTPFGFNALPRDMACVPKCRGNFFALYLVPNLLHFLAYLCVWYLMRTPESEKLEHLMERGFLQTTRTTGWMMAHKKLVSSLRRIIWMCLAWLILSAAIHGLIVGSRIQDLNLTWLKYGEPVKTLLIVLTLSSLTFNDLICGAIVTSYTVHCQLNISYILNLCASIREKRIEFQEFYKRIEEAKKFLDYLNNEQALGLSLLLITVGCKLSVGVYALLASGEFNHWNPYAIVIVLLSLLFWSTLFAVPIVQSIRLTGACSDLKQIGHEIRARPFGYQDTDQSDLDSLLLYTTNLSMNARILRVPVTSPCILIILIIFLIVILMFGQLGLLNV